VLKYAANDDPELGPLYYQIGMIYDDKKDLDMAIENYENALKFSSNIGSIIEDIYKRIGLIYHEKRHYSLALINYEKALTIYTKQKSDTTLLLYHVAWV
jgi:tetratricopeptide (TPR) repeat protein